MPAPDASNPFAKDFAYLHPFLERLQEHAESLGNAPLQELLAGESARWREIDALLSAGSDAGTGADAPSPSGVPAIDSFRLTVGTLRGLEPRRRADD